MVNVDQNLVINFANQVVPAHPEYTGPFRPKCIQNVEFQRDLTEQVRPFVNDSGLYQLQQPKVKQIQLLLVLTVKADCQPIFEVVHVKSTACLSIRRKITAHDLPVESREAWARFVFSSCLSLVQAAILTFRLPVPCSFLELSFCEERDLAVFSSLKHQSNKVYTEVNHEELAIEMSVPNQSFMSKQKLVVCQKLLNEVQNALQPGSSMTVTGYETGMNTFTIFCEGLNADDTCEHLAQHLEKAGTSLGELSLITQSDGIKKRRELAKLKSNSTAPSS